MSSEKSFYWKRTGDLKVVAKANWHRFFHFAEKGGKGGGQLKKFSPLRLR